MTCKNCNAELLSKYCPDCGQPAVLNRIDRHYIVHEIQHVLHFEKGILYTIRELITSPGKNVRTFLLENRSRLIKPIVFLLVTSLVYSICNYIFHFEDDFVKTLEKDQSTTTSIFKWIQAHYGYGNIMMGIFIAFWTRLFFKKYQYNFFEILVLLCFVMGTGMLIYAVFGIIQGLTHIKLIQIGGIVTFVYTTWAIANFFDKTKFSSYLKSFLAYLIGILSFSLLIIFVGTLIDLLIKK